MFSRENKIKRKKKNGRNVEYKRVSMIFLIIFLEFLARELEARPVHRLIFSPIILFVSFFSEFERVSLSFITGLPRKFNGFFSFLFFQTRPGLTCVSSFLMITSQIRKHN